MGYSRWARCPRAAFRPGSSVGTSVRLKIGRSAVRPRPWPPPKPRIKHRDPRFPASLPGEHDRGRTHRRGGVVARALVQHLRPICRERRPCVWDFSDHQGPRRRLAGSSGLGCTDRLFAGHGGLLCVEGRWHQGRTVPPSRSCPDRRCRHCGVFWLGLADAPQCVAAAPTFGAGDDCDSHCRSRLWLVGEGSIRATNPLPALTGLGHSSAVLPPSRPLASV